MGASSNRKTTLLKKLFPQAFFIDLLKTEELLRFTQSPSELRQIIKGLSDRERNNPIIVDEVQKVPMLLDEIHWHIENLNVHFILSGSSARKLKKNSANMLGGRAWTRELRGLTFEEIANDFDLSRALNYGFLPKIYLSNSSIEYLQCYRKRSKRRLALSPKFYFFDVGVVNYLAKRKEIEPRTDYWGRAFENWIYNEIMSYKAYKNPDMDFHFWKTSSNIEVDFILGDMEVAIEVKGRSKINNSHLSGLRSVIEDFPRIKKRILVCQDKYPRKTDDDIDILPYSHFLDLLWSNLLIK